MHKLLLNNLFILSLLLFIGCKNHIKSNKQHSQLILDRHGRLITIELSSDDKFRYWEESKNISTYYKEAILQKEDQYFYNHFGFNPISLARASFYYLTGNPKGGASTITMQLARLFYQLDTRSVWGKLNQIAYALYIESRLSKKEIFEAYLNYIPMGRNIEGIESAAYYYFEKPSKKLNKKQLNFLLKLPQKPYLSESDTNLFLNQNRPFEAPHFTNYIHKLNFKNSKLQTTLDLELQKGLSERVKNYIILKTKNGIRNASLLVINSKTNEVLSYIGSSDFQNKEIAGQVDGIQAKRSPGSTLKPFIYARAFESGLVIPQSIVFDSPLPYRTPENYDRTYDGPMSVENALVLSRNIPAVYLNNSLQREGVGLYQLLKAIYPSIDKDANYYGSSIALGALEVSSWQLAELYSMLANNGSYQQLSLLLNEKRKKTEFLSPAASVMVKDVLSKIPRPHFKDSEHFSEKDGEVYWKTGTSFGFKDAWAAGIWKDFVLVTWVGNFDARSNPHFIGAYGTGPLFFDAIDFLRGKSLKHSHGNLKHTYHEDISQVKVCSISGHLPNKNCPSLRESLYISGVSPLKKCQVHKKIRIATGSGLRACQEYQGKTSEKVFEFFSSEKFAIYKRYGIKLNPPPRYITQCEKNFHFTKGEAPVIISPKIGFTYIIEDKAALIPLEARTSTDANTLSWYLNDKLVKKTKTGTETTIKVSSGNYVLKIIDNQGRVARRELRVK